MIEQRQTKLVIFVPRWLIFAGSVTLFIEAHKYLTDKTAYTTLSQNIMTTNISDYTVIHTTLLQCVHVLPSYVYHWNK